MNTHEPARADDFDFSLDFDQEFDGVTIHQLLLELTEAQYAVMLGNRSFADLDFRSPGYVRAREISDSAQLQLTKAKWHIGGITGAYNGVYQSQDPHADAHKGLTAIAEAKRLADALRDARGKPVALEAIELPAVDLDTEGTECLRVDGVPIVPSICPVVILQGSSYEMGWQYAQQIIEIYGSFNFDVFRQLDFPDDRLAILRKWEAELERGAPEIIEMCRGWADGATAAGVNMSYDHVLHLWTGAEPPAGREDGFSAFFPDIRLPVAMYFSEGLILGDGQQGQGVPADANPAELCSGICAWGTATTDGMLKAAATTDHDCWMQATIVAYPDEGNAFIYTPFTVTGWLPGMGGNRFAGHPGMNDQGVAYVHHGGEAHVMEPEQSWGYGVPRGSATFHTLRYANDAREAKDMQFAFPIGDVGAVLGTAGGQWADHENGYVIESRERTEEHPHGLVREFTLDHDGQEHPILYAGNSAMHPAATGYNHGFPPGVLDYDIERGWHTMDKSYLEHESLKVVATRMTAIGGNRPKTFFELAIPASGSIDHDFLAKLYRTGTPGYPDVDEWFVAMRDIRSGERKMQQSPAKRLNAFTALMEPASDGQGLYHACIGPLKHSLPPGGTGHEYYYYDETNAYWTLRLAQSPEELVADAEERAVDDIAQARRLLGAESDDMPSLGKLTAWLAEAESALEEGRASEFGGSPSAEKSATMARAVRRFTRAQVRARQVRDALVPPGNLRN